MKRFPLLFVTALIGLVVSAPAQRSHEGRAGRQNRGTVVHQQSRVDHSRSARQSRHVGSVRDARPTRSARRSHRAPVRQRTHGHWVTRCEQVLVPGYWTTEHVPAVFGWVFDSCGHRHWGIVTPACSRRVWVPARYETQSRRVWVRH